MKTRRKKVNFPFSDEAGYDWAAGAKFTNTEAMAFGYTSWDDIIQLEIELESNGSIELPRPSLQISNVINWGTHFNFVKSDSNTSPVYTANKRYIITLIGAKGSISGDLFYKGDSNHNTWLRKIYLGPSVKSITGGGFKWCEKLEEFIAPGLEILGGGSTYSEIMRDTTSLKKIYLPSILSLSSACFTGSGLEEVVLGPNLNYIGNWCFDGSNNLKKITFLGDKLPTSGFNPGNNSFLVNKDDLFFGVKKEYYDNYYNGYIHDYPKLANRIFITPNGEGEFAMGGAFRFTSNNDNWKANIVSSGSTSYGNQTTFISSDNCQIGLSGAGTGGIEKNGRQVHIASKTCKSDANDDAIIASRESEIQNQTGETSTESALIGGYQNILKEKRSVIAGGRNNKIDHKVGTGGDEEDAQYAFIGGGQSNTVRHRNAVTIGGIGLKTSDRDQTLVGKYNLAVDGLLFAVGAGSSDSDRKNALEVYSDSSVRASNIPRIGTDVLRLVDLFARTTSQPIWDDSSYLRWNSSSNKVEVKLADNATNVTTNINGKAITSIFESDGITVKNATNAKYTNYINLSSESQLWDGNNWTDLAKHDFDFYLDNGVSININGLTIDSNARGHWYGIGEGDKVVVWSDVNNNFHSRFYNETGTTQGWFTSLTTVEQAEQADKVDGNHISVVPSLPTPIDPNTIYFITG